MPDKRIPRETEQAQEKTQQAGQRQNTQPERDRRMAAFSPEEQEVIMRAARQRANQNTMDAMRGTGSAPGQPPMMPGAMPPQMGGRPPVPGAGAPGMPPQRPDQMQSSMMGQAGGRAMQASGQAQPTSDRPIPAERTGASVITQDMLQKAEQTLRKYKDGKGSIEKRIVSAQEWWKLHNWKELNRQGIQGLNTVKGDTAWLWNCIVGKHADFIDSYPEPVILPRVEDDKEEATRLSDIVPVVMEMNGFEEEYNQMGWQKFIEGTGCLGCFWDKDLMNGLGDISIKKCNVLNIFWKPGVNDIQDSPAFFHVSLMENDLIEELWPQCKGQLGTSAFNLTHYRYDDNVDTTNCSLVIDWYYKKYVGRKRVVHLVKFVCQTVLYATEDDPQLRERGLYDDGLYPFVFDPLYPQEGTPCGYGLVDIGKDTQADIDKISAALVVNAMTNASPRYFIRADGGINEQEFADLTKPFVHVSGTLNDDSLRRIESPGIPANTLDFMMEKIDELKWITGNTDVKNGSTPSGVTAASAIAALREDAGRSSKDSTKASYRAYSRLVTMVIERIRQFYDMPRQFRITGQRGQERFISYTNQRLVAQSQGTAFGYDLGYRLPAFDISVHAQRENAYTKASNNELALQLYGNGIFNPQMVDQALLTLDMMDFKDKEEIQQKVAQNGGLQQTVMQLLQISQQLAAQAGDQNAVMALQQIGQGMGMPVAPLPAGGGGQAQLPEGDSQDPLRQATKPNRIVERAAERAANASRPN